jgi:hypothetical protein
MGKPSMILVLFSLVLCFSHGKIVVHEEMLIETIVGNQIPSPWFVMFSTRDGSQQKITKYENGIRVAQNELFPTYVEIGIDYDNDFQGSSSYYINSLLTIKDHDHCRSRLLCDQNGVFQPHKIV